MSSNWIPPVYPFELRNEYGMTDARAIFCQFKKHFPNSDLPDNMNNRPELLEDEFIAFHAMNAMKAASFRHAGAQHEQSQVWLLQEMVERIRAHDRETELQWRRTVDKKEQVERDKRRWAKQRAAGRKKVTLQRKAKKNARIRRNFKVIELANGHEVHLGK